MCITLATSSVCHAVPANELNVVVDLSQSLPALWQKALESRISEIKMLYTRVLRIQGFATFFEDIASEDGVEVTSRLLLAHQVRNAMIAQVRVEIDAIVGEINTSEGQPSEEMQAELAALMTLAPSLRSFNLTTVAGLRKAIDDLHELRNHLPTQLQLAVTSVAQIQGGSVATQNEYFGTAVPDSPAKVKLERRSANTRNIVIGVLAAVAAVGVGSSVWLWHKSRQKGSGAAQMHVAVAKERSLSAVDAETLLDDCFIIDWRTHSRDVVVSLNKEIKTLLDAGEIESVTGDLVVPAKQWNEAFELLARILEIKPGRSGKCGGYRLAGFGGRCMVRPVRTTNQVCA